MPAIQIVAARKECRRWADQIGVDQSLFFDALAECGMKFPGALLGEIASFGANKQADQPCEGGIGQRSAIPNLLLIEAVEIVISCGLYRIMLRRISLQDD